MSDQQNSQLTIRILGRDYSVACPEGERESLLASAEYLAKRMATIQRKGKTLGMDRIAVLAALNITRDLLSLQKQQQQATLDEDTDERLNQLQLRVEAALDDDH